MNAGSAFFQKVAAEATLPVIGPLQPMNSQSKKFDQAQAQGIAKRQGANYKQATFEDWIPRRAYSDSNTFTFGIVLLVIIGLGIFFGIKRRSHPY